MSQGKVALVSSEDYERVAAYKWSLDKNGYAVRKVQRREGGRVVQRKTMLHRFIIDAPKGMDVDHANHDPLDNRRTNIRIATRGQNSANSGPRPGSASQYKGVFTAQGGRWRAEICVAGVKQHLGTFVDEAGAAHAYDRAAHAAWGRFAYLNFPHELPPSCGS